MKDASAGEDRPGQSAPAVEAEPTSDGTLATVLTVIHIQSDGTSQVLTFRAADLALAMSDGVMVPIDAITFAEALRSRGGLS
jgi:hypothetical protein